MARAKKRRPAAKKKARRSASRSTTTNRRAKRAAPKTSKKRSAAKRRARRRVHHNPPHRVKGKRNVYRFDNGKEYKVPRVKRRSAAAYLATADERADGRLPQRKGPRGIDDTTAALLTRWNFPRPRRRKAAKKGCVCAPKKRKSTKRRSGATAKRQMQRRPRALPAPRASRELVTTDAIDRTASIYALSR